MGKNRKRVGIVTLNGYFNYGNRLQNYALQEVVKELGFEVDSLVIPRGSGYPNYRKENKIKKLLRISNLKPREILQRIQNRILLHENKDIIKARTEIFQQFTKEFLNERFLNGSKEAIENVGLDYDFFIVGSDQVWNPYNITYAEDAFFLTFADSKKRISYAASFGISNLPDYYKKMVMPWLSEMKSISVREDSGTKIVKELTGRDVVVSLDPTLLLSKEKWLSVAKEGPKPKKRYILTYFLGEKPEKAVSMIKEISEKYDYAVVHLANIMDKQLYMTGPQEFLDYINFADCVLTDSFHGLAFSVLMETPFVIFERIGSHNMYSRVETLLSLLNLNKREVSQIIDLKDLFEIDFTQVRSILQKEREKANDYLKKALDLQ